MYAVVVGLLVVVAFFAGVVDAIAGGGGLITLPALMSTGLTEHVALATNKGQSVWGAGAAMIAFWRGGRVDRRQATVTFPLAMVGAIAGASLQLWVRPEVLRPIVIAMLALAVPLVFVDKPARAHDGERRLPVAAALALVLGAYDGFFGPGTGTFLIVGFIALRGKRPVGATADAKVVNFASNLASLATLAYAGNVVWSVALPMAGGQLAGGLLGARLAIRGGAWLVRGAVVVVAAALVAKLAWQLLVS